MAVQSLKALFPKLVANYGDDVARGVATYGDDVAEGLVKYGDEASDWASRISKRGKPKFSYDYIYDVDATNFKKGFPIRSVPEDPYFSNIFDRPYLQQEIPHHNFPIYSQSGNFLLGNYSFKDLLDLEREYILPF